MQQQALDLKRAQALAAQWASETTPGLKAFIADATLDTERLLSEVREIYVRPLSLQQKSDIMQLGRWLAGEIWRQGAETDDALRRSLK